MTRKTNEQIATEVGKLREVKEVVQEYTVLGGNNHTAIEAQWAVLERRMSLDEVYDHYGDEDDDEFDQYTLDAAISAYNWMVGSLAQGEASPSEGWL